MAKEHLNLWLASFAKTPHPFNQEAMRDSNGNIIRPSLTEKELLGLQETSKNILSPEEQDIHNLLTGKRKLRKGETRPSPEIAKAINQKVAKGTRLGQSLQEDYTPSQLNAVKRKQLLRPKALKFDEPSSILPGLTKGDELEQAYKTLKDPVVKSTVNDIARLDRFKRQASGQLKPHERTLSRISAQEAQQIQQRLQAARSANPETFKQIVDVHKAINNTAKNPGVQKVTENIPGMKESIINRVKSGDTVTPSYINNPESIAYAGPLQQRKGQELIPDPRVSNLTEAEINKAKRKGLQVSYNPAQRVPQSALDKRISMIENISNSLDEPISLSNLPTSKPPAALPSKSTAKPKVSPKNIKPPTNPTGVDPYRAAIEQGLMNRTELPVSSQVQLALDSLNSHPAQKPNPIQAVQNRLRAAETNIPVVNNTNVGPIMHPVDDALNSVKQKYGALVGNWNPLQDLQSLSRKINPPSIPVETPIPETPTPDVNPMANPFVAEEAAKKVKRTPTPRNTQGLEERIANRVTKQLQNTQAIPKEIIPPKVEPQGLIQKWRALPRESRGLAKIGAGVVSAGGLLLAQSALAKSMAKQKETEEANLQRQQMLYSPMPRPIQQPMNPPYPYM